MLLSFVFFTLSVLCFGQEQSSLVVNGTITDTQGRPLEGVGIALICGSDTFRTATASDGAYTLKYHATKPCNIFFIKKGYKPSGGTLQPQPVTTISLPLEADEKTVTLDEVKVQGNRVTTTGNKTSYLPDKRQREASHDGIDLLFRLAIPQLDVNPITGSVSTADQSSVSLYIDFRKASLTEIGQLRAKDIKRVELYENAIDLFPGERKVLNYVLNHYDTGGYVDIATDSRVIDRSGKYNAQVSLDHKNINYTALGGFSLSKDDGQGMEKTEWVGLEQPFTRTTRSTQGVRWGRAYNGLFRTTYNTKQTTLFGQVALLTDKTPLQVMKTQTDYAPAVFPQAETDNETNSRGTSLVGSLFFRHDYKGGNKFYGRATYSYSHNSYNRTYSETGTDSPILSNTKEHLNNLDAQINYIIRLGKASSLGFSIWETLAKSKGMYDGGSNIQNLTSNEFQLYPTYQVTFGGKLSMYAQAGFDVSTYHAEGYERKTKVWPRPAFNLDWTMNSRNRLSLSASMGSSYPTLNFFTAARQRVNLYEVKQGNPLLGTTRIINAVLSHSLIATNLQFSSYVGYMELIDVNKDYYFTEPSTLVHTYKTDGDFYDVDAGSNLSVYLLKRALQLKGGAAFHHRSFTGLYASHYNTVGYNLDAIYYYKHFNAYAFFRPAQTYLFSLPQRVRTIPIYGFAVGWSNKGWKAEAGVRNIFSHVKPYHSRFDYGVYAYDEYSYSDTRGAQAYLKLNYSFDFGRTIKHEKIEETNLPQSGILHP